MSAGTTRKVKDALVQILSGLQLDNDAAFTKVIDNTHDEYQGYPIARILPDSSRSSVEDSTSWLHQDSYSIIVTWPLTDPSNIESDMYNDSYDIADLVRNSLEHDDHASLLNQLDPSLTWQFATVPNTTWRVATSKSGGAVLAITLSVQVTYSQSAL